LKSFTPKVVSEVTQEGASEVSLGSALGVKRENVFHVLDWDINSGLASFVSPYETVSFEAVHFKIM
jgi:hypothetical protein